MKAPGPRSANPASHRRTITAWSLALTAVVMAALSLMVGSQGWDALVWQDPASPIIRQIRLPRTAGVLALGLLLGTSGALAQGLFRNPLADPYLLGAGSGAALAVTVVAAASAGSVWTTGGASGSMIEVQSRLGLTSMGMAFLGALGGVALTLMLARGAQHTHRLLLAGLVVGIVLGALTDLVASFAPDAWRQRQSLLLGQTNLLGLGAVVALGVTALIVVPLGLSMARALDALTLGDEAARSLGLPLPQMRAGLVALIALATAVAVSQAGLILFVALAAAHIVRQLAPSGHRFLIGAAALAGAALLMAADVLARWIMWPQELPVGVVTGVGGGLYLLVLLNRQGVR